MKINHLALIISLAPCNFAFAAADETVDSKQEQENTAPKNYGTELKLNNFVDSLKFYGDVEFNLDGTSKSGQLTSLKTSANKDWKKNNPGGGDINGRILFGIDGYKNGDGNDFSGFSIQPLADMNGTVFLDDAVFFFGNEKNWQAKIGRFEAYDMFPLNQDTFIEYSGNTANDLYADGYGYIYMMKEGRGRSSNGGSALYSKTIDNWYFEVNTLVEKGTSLYDGSDYHGNELEDNKNVIYMRPVIAWKDGTFSAAVAMETNIVNDAYGYTNNNGDFIDQSNRNGYGLSMTWNGLTADPENGVVTNFSMAYMDATDEQDFTVGANVLWRRFELGYIYAHNDIQAFNTSGIDADFNGDNSLDEPGIYDIHTIHASYQIPNVMNVANFNLYLGVYYSVLDVDPYNKNADVSDVEDARYGVRARFKYFF